MSSKFKLIFSKVFHFSIIKSKEGVGLIGLLLVGAAIVSGGVYLISSYMIQISNHKNKFENVLGLRVALNSALDFTQYAIQSRWCMDELWWQDDPVKCNLNHPRNLERLLFSDSVIKDIESAGNISFEKPIRITHLEKELNPENMSSLHPLKRIFNNIPQKIVAIKFILDRILDANRPTSGQEAFIKVQVLVTVGGGLNANTQVSMSSFLGFYPRELNSFALILRGDIILNADDLSSHAPNSVRFPLLESKEKSGKGLIFLSPVFTNHNAYLPDTQDPLDVRFNNVTFGDKLILAGSVFQNGVFFKPTTLGHPSEQFFVQQSRFGGFLKGVGLEPLPDKGLEYLFDPSAVVDDSLMRNCILRNQIKVDPSLTGHSILVVKQSRPPFIDANKKTFVYHMGLSRKNEFREASATRPMVMSENRNSDIIDKATLEVKERKKHPFPILKASIQFGEHSNRNDIVIANLSLESELEMTLKEPPRPIPGPSVSPGAGIHSDNNINSKPELHIKTHSMTSNQVGIEITFINPRGFYAAPSIKFNAFDFGTDEEGINRRDKRFGPNRELVDNTLVFTGGNENDIDGPHFSASDWSPLPKTGFDRVASMQDLPKDGENPADMQCNSGKNLAFATTDWSKDFSKSARTSWKFNPPPIGEDLIFPDQAPEKDFHIYSIVPGKCLIKSNAKFVAGFLTCNMLKIEPRTAPLWIIGTVIAGALDIAPEAVKAGIYWSNIYHPIAQSLLREKGILKAPNNSGVCQDIPQEPFWSPVVNLNSFANMYYCSPSSLRERADPFMWTTVDPVCGLEYGSSAVVCKIKNRPLNFSLVEFVRESGL